MCPFGEGTFDDSKQGMMSRPMAREALNQARTMGALSVKLNFRGEPGLSPLLLDAVRHAKTLGYVEVMINTNLTSFSKRRLKALCDAGLDLMIVSVDGVTKEIYEAIRVNGDFDKLLENFRYLNSLPNTPRIRINFTVQDRNRHEAIDMNWRFGSLCDEIQFNPIRSDNSGERQRCGQPFQRLIVAWNGQVFACCNSWENQYPVGQFPEQTLTEIWNGERLKTLQGYAKTPEQGPPCDTCLVGCSYK
jgi:radical SAM protein with 4Fe4S-binding SPASM domain